MDVLSDKILNFWFVELEPKDWFQGGAELDNRIKHEFLADLKLVHDGKLDYMLNEKSSCLAFIILTDQFPRNIYRGSAESFAYAAQAEKAAQICIEQNFIQSYNDSERQFALLPFIHSENMADHSYAHQCLERWLHRHPMYKEIKQSWDAHSVAIEKFGRYPHRNKILGRESTLQELEFLKQPNSSW